MVEKIEAMVNGGHRDWALIENEIDKLARFYRTYLVALVEHGYDALLNEKRLFQKYPKIEYYCTHGAINRLLEKYDPAEHQRRLEQLIRLNNGF